MAVEIPRAYIFPQDISGFGIVGKHYYEELRKYYPVRMIPMTALLFYVTIFRYKDVIMHPLLYAGLRDTFPRRESLIGVEVADSDRVSEKAVEVCNKADMLIVPSEFSRKAYTTSGVKVPVKVARHGFPDSWLTIPKERFSSFLFKALRGKGRCRCLFFHIHSWYRKGGDLVVKVMKRVQRMYPDVWLVVKGGGFPDELKQVTYHPIAGFYSEIQLREIYDTSEIYLMFSRGGSFELNALEALSRGLVVLYPEGSSVAEYADGYGVPIKVVRHPVVLPDNAIHIGRGWEIDVEDAVTKLKDVIENLDEYKARASEFPIGRWTWSVVGKEFAEAVGEVWG